MLCVRGNYRLKSIRQESPSYFGNEINYEIELQSGGPFGRDSIKLSISQQSGFVNCPVPGRDYEVLIVELPVQLEAVVATAPATTTVESPVTVRQPRPKRARTPAKKKRS